MRRTARGLLATALALGLVLTAPAPGSTQEPEPPGRTPLRLVSQTPWVADDQPLVIDLAIPGGLPDGGSVELTLYGALTSREPLVRADRDRTLLGDVRDILSIPVELVQRVRNGDAYRLQLRTDGVESGIPVADPGVYPLEIALAGPDGEAGPSMLTFVTRYDDEARESRLWTALVLPLHAPPAFGPDGSAVLSDRARRIFEVRSALLDRYRSVPLSVVPTPETLEALAAADTQLLERVRDALRGRNVIGGPYVRLDIAAFAADPDLAGPLTDEFAAGAQALRRTLRLPFDRHTWAGSGNPTTSALDALAGAGIDRGLFREESVSATAPVTEPVVISGGTGQAFQAVLADAGLRAHVNGTADPVLMANRALADLALLASPPDDGGVATDSGDAGVAIELPATRPLPAEYLDTVLRGLSLPGPLRPVSLPALLDADLAGEVGPEPGPTVTGIPLAGADLASYSRGLELARAQLAGYQSFAGRRDDVAAELRRRLLISGSIDLTEAQRGGYLQSVTTVVRNRTAAVDVSDDTTVTLTSREGDIPLTIHNDTGGPVNVRLAFDSSNRLDFPDGPRRQVRLEEGPNRVEVPVEARSSGSFPLRITVTSPDGVLIVSRARVTVRSTFVSGVGLVLSIGALLFLVLWWALHFRSTRRNRRLVDPDELPVNTDPDQARPDEPSTGNPEDPAPV
ncbi:MAG TPA: DUF6049 family protein [Acidimicrobiales bacterium]|nr:DUF6049 family protein [Acidimicrobiales bacterium]